MTVIIRSAPRTNCRTRLCCDFLIVLACSLCLFADGQCDVPHDVTVLTTAIDRAIDSAAFNGNDGILHIRVFVEEDTLVTLTATEDVTRERMTDNVIIITWHTNRTSSHRDSSRAIHIGSLATTIDVRQDVSTRNRHIRITFHLTSTIQVNALA